MQQFEQCTNRSVMRNGIRHWNNSMEPEDAFLVTVHYCPPVRAVSVSILYIVEAPRVCLPYVDLGASYGFAGCVFDSAEN